MGKFLILAGFLVIVLGILIHFKVDIPFLTEWIGRLPGDIVIKKDNMTFYFPISTSLVASALLSLVVSLFRK